MDSHNIPVDIKTLIQTSDITVYNKNKLIDKLQQNFTEDEQKLYVCNLFLYLNYHPIDDFIVNLDNVWKFIGFSNKGNAKRLLQQHFKENIDYKIIIFRSDDNKTLLLRSEKQKTIETRGGHNQETIMLNINTFKKLCLKANTQNADKIHDYYIKLEMVYNELVKEEIQEKQKLIEEQSKQIEQLENKPHTEGFDRASGYIYLIKDTSKPGHYKIGFSSDPQKRISQLNIASSTYSLDIACRFETFDKEFAEKIIHCALIPLKIKNRKEWFYFKDDFELAYAINTIKSCLQFINQFNISNYDQLKNKPINIPNELKEISKDNHLKEQIKDDINKRCQIVAQQMSNKTGKYKGVCWVAEKNKWKSELKRHHAIFFLGYYESELEAAKAYNDYATFLNKTYNESYTLNYIDDYKPNPRDIPQENRQKQECEKTSRYIGVSYDSIRNYYVVSIKHNGKTYHLGNNECEVECAKLYNQQAFYFNNQFKSNYELNEIDNYTTIERNVYKEIQENKITSKSSQYYGVVYSKQKKKYRSLLVHNKKQLHIGFFENELDAAKAYNKKAEELNRLGKYKYKLNNVI